MELTEFRNGGSGTRGSLTYEFKCTESQGGLLIVQDYVQKTSLMHHAKEVLRYIRQNHDSWYGFATGDNYGIHCDPEDIIMVRSTMKTSAWAVAAFKDSGDRIHNLSFNVVGGPLGNAGFQLASQVAVQSSVEYRAGPGHASLPETDPTAVSSITPLVNPYVLAEHKFAASRAIVLDPRRNQTVFLGYWKVRRRLAFLKNIVASPYPQRPSRYDEPGSDASPENRVRNNNSGYSVETIPLPVTVSYITTSIKPHVFTLFIAP